MSGALLAAVMARPEQAETLGPAAWNALIAAARAEQMAGNLAARIAGVPVPPAAARVLADALASAEQGRIAALWEAEMARRALAPIGVPVVLLKGTAFVAAGLAAGRGRSIGDLDILVPFDALDAVETALIGGGWEWVKPEPYDDLYYRRWMHELPPLIHRTRDRMIDVHHTILPRTARPTPDACALLRDAVAIGRGLHMLCPEDMLVHAAAHLFADGDLQGGLRNLWDIHCLLEEYGGEGFEAGLLARAELHGLRSAMARALRLRAAIFKEAGGLRGSDRLFRRRLLARDGWGRLRHKETELGFYLRGHLLRMPPAMLARHLWTKWRGGHRP